MALSRISIPETDPTEHGGKYTRNKINSNGTAITKTNSNVTAITRVN
jgi:hypothetical protein